MFKKIILWSIVALVAIQLIPVDRTNLPVKKSENFVDIFQTPENVKEILKNACYDCHTNETVYPDYAYIAPISWSIKDHVNEGREHANFSIWGTYNKEIKQSILEKSAKTIREGSMPLPGYIVYHHSANLNAGEKKVLSDYFETILKSGNY